MASPPSPLRRAVTWPPVASIRPCTTASPMPRPPARSAARARDPVELLEQARQRVVGDPRAAVLDREAHRVRVAAASSRPGSGRRRRVLDGIVEDVRDGCIEEHGIDANHGRLDRELELAVGEARVERGRRPASAASSRSYSSRSARSTPASIRLMSSRFATSALRYSTSRSIACAFACRSAGDSAESESRLPAAARITASGVRKSWETDWRSDVLRASPWRATSAALASAAMRSRATACPIWSAAAASSRVCV